MIGRLQPDQVVYVCNHQVELVRVRSLYTSSLVKDTGTTLQFEAQVDEQLKTGDTKKILGFKPSTATAYLKLHSTITSTNNQSDIQPLKEYSQERKIKELEVEVMRLQALLDDQALELATLKDFKIYLENQDSRTQVADNGGRAVYRIK